MVCYDSCFKFTRVTTKQSIRDLDNDLIKKTESHQEKLKASLIRPQHKLYIQKIGVVKKKEKKQPTTA